MLTYFFPGAGELFPISDAKDSMDPLLEPVLDPLLEPVLEPDLDPMGSIMLSSMFSPTSLCGVNDIMIYIFLRNKRK